MFFSYHPPDEDYRRTGFVNTEDSPYLLTVSKENVFVSSSAGYGQIAGCASAEEAWEVLFYTAEMLDDGVRTVRMEDVITRVRMQALMEAPEGEAPPWVDALDADDAGKKPNEASPPRSSGLDEPCVGCGAEAFFSVPMCSRCTVE
jgi:hypothetical protein